jgi:hypothetical protein
LQTVKRTNPAWQKNLSSRVQQLKNRRLNFRAQRQDAQNFSLLRQDTMALLQQ